MRAEGSQSCRAANAQWCSDWNMKSWVRLLMSRRRPARRIIYDFRRYFTLRFSLLFSSPLPLVFTFCFFLQFQFNSHLSLPHSLSVCVCLSLSSAGRDPRPLQKPNQHHYSAGDRTMNGNRLKEEREGGGRCGKDAGVSETTLSIQRVNNAAERFNF